MNLRKYGNKVTRFSLYLKLYYFIRIIGPVKIQDEQGYDLNSFDLCSPYIAKIYFIIRLNIMSQQDVLETKKLF